MSNQENNEFISVPGVDDIKKLVKQVLDQVDKLPAIANQVNVLGIEEVKELLTTGGAIAHKITPEELDVLLNFIMSISNDFLAALKSSEGAFENTIDVLRSSIGTLDSFIKHNIINVQNSDSVVTDIKSINESMVRINQLISSISPINLDKEFKFFEDAIASLDGFQSKVIASLARPMSSIVQKLEDFESTQLKNIEYFVGTFKDVVNQLPEDVKMKLPFQQDNAYKQNVNSELPDSSIDVGIDIIQGLRIIGASIRILIKPIILITETTKNAIPIAIGVEGEAGAAAALYASAGLSINPINISELIASIILIPLKTLDSTILNSMTILDSANNILFETESSCPNNCKE